MQNFLSLVLTYYVAFVVIVDPFGIVPIYLTMTERQTEEEKRLIRIKATGIATVILVLVCCTGTKIFAFFGITVPAFQVAGGILLLLIAISQLNANHPHIKDEEKREGIQKADISVFPLATPLLAGPGAISTIVLYLAQSGGWIQQLALVAAVVLSMGSVYLALQSANLLFRVLGQTGLNLITRLMGIILAAVAVQFIFDGFAHYVTTIIPK